jgi:hypothetical protein
MEPSTLLYCAVGAVALVVVVLLASAKIVDVDEIS